MKKTEQIKTAIAALGLGSSPAADAMGLKTSVLSTPLGQMLNGEGGTLRNMLRSSTETANAVYVGPSTTKTTVEPEPTNSKPSGEIFTLKPGMWGMSVDLKEAWRWIRRRLK
jgi:hypothetical protein